MGELTFPDLNHCNIYMLLKSNREQGQWMAKSVMTIVYGQCCSLNLLLNDLRGLSHHLLVHRGKFKGRASTL